MRYSQRTKRFVALGARFKFVFLLSLMLLSPSLISNGETYAAATFATNAGGPTYVAMDGTIYQADAFYTGGQVAYIPATITGTTDPNLYDTERYGNTFSYNITLPNGTYTVTLKFAEIYWNQAGKRIFNVSVQGNPAISNLDIFTSAGGKDKAYDVPIPNVIVTNGMLSISFTTVADKAKVSAIEVVPQYRPLSGASGYVNSDGTVAYKIGYFHVNHGGVGSYDIIPDCPDGTQSCFADGQVPVPCTCSVRYPGNPVSFFVCDIGVQFSAKGPSTELALMFTPQFAPVGEGTLTDIDFQFTCGQ
jgi:Malectin domain